MKNINFILLILGFYFISVSGTAEDIYFATGTDIKRWDLSQSKTSTVISGQSRAVSLDFDIADRKIFWGDVFSDGIYKADLSTSGTATGKTKIASAATPDGLAVDWVLKHVYWTDYGTREIMVSNYDGTGLKTLIYTYISAPRAIALYQEDGYMFWTDWGRRNPKIERTSMDGNFRTVIVSENLHWPNGLTIDPSAKRIYWIDGKLSRIDSANFDGSDVQNIITAGHSYLNHPFSLAIVGTYIYFTDWGSTSYLKRMKTSGLYKTNLFSQTSKVFDLKVYNSSSQVRGTSLDNLATLCQRCSTNQLCLPRPHDDGCVSVSCSCPDSQVTCSASFHTSCATDSYIPPLLPYVPIMGASQGGDDSSEEDEDNDGNSTADNDDDIEETVLIGLMVACTLCGVLIAALVGVCIRQKVCKRNNVQKAEKSKQPPPSREQPPPYAVAVANVPQHYPNANQHYMKGNNYYNTKGQQPLSITDLY